MVGIARQRHVFRASWWIRVGVLLALGLWTAVGAWAIAFAALPVESLLAIGFFVAFFVVFALYYWRMVYVVDETGVTVRSGTDRTHFPWESIESVRRSPLPLAGWEVSTARGSFVLDVFVGHRARLLDVIVARAGLFPSA